jgi:hypothetical protein
MLICACTAAAVQPCNASSAIHAPPNKSLVERCRYAWRVPGGLHACRTAAAACRTPRACRKRQADQQLGHGWWLCCMWSADLHTPGVPCGQLQRTWQRCGICHIFVTCENEQQHSNTKWNLSTTAGVRYCSCDPVHQPANLNTA